MLFKKTPGQKMLNLDFSPFLLFSSIFVLISVAIFYSFFLFSAKKSEKEIDSPVSQCKTAKPKTTTAKTLLEKDSEVFWKLQKIIGRRWLNNICFEEGKKKEQE